MPLYTHALVLTSCVCISYAYKHFSVPDTFTDLEVDVIRVVGPDLFSPGQKVNHPHACIRIHLYLIIVLRANLILRNITMM